MRPGALKPVDPLSVVETFIATHPTKKAAAVALGLGPSYLGSLLKGRRKIHDGILKKLGLKRIVVRVSNRG